MSGLFGYVRISVPIVTIWCPTIGSMPRTFSPRRCGGGHRTWFLAVFGLPIEIEGMDFLAYNAGAKPLKPLCIGPAGIIPPHLYSIWMARPPVAAPCTPRARSTRRPGAQRQAMAGRDHIGRGRRLGAPAGRAGRKITRREPDARRSIRNGGPGPSARRWPAGITSAPTAGEARQLAARPPRGSMAWSRRAGRKITRREPDARRSIRNGGPGPSARRWPAGITSAPAAGEAHQLAARPPRGSIA